MGLLDGKVAVITGAGGGIGREHSLLMAKEGAKIVINDLGGARDGSGKGTAMADKVVDEIKALGGAAVPDYNSVSTVDGAKGIIETAVKNFGQIDILVNNAGILRDRTLLKMSEDEWDIVISVHLKGTFLCSQAAGMVMKDTGKGGRIINTTSIAGLRGNFGQSNYGAAKAGIVGLTKVNAIELAKHAITVNAIAPIAKTRLTEDLPAFSSVGAKLAPSFISPLVVFLASDLAKNITGKVFNIQGGLITLWFEEPTKGVSKEGVWTPLEIADKIEEIMKH